MRALAAIAALSILGLTFSPASYAQSRGHVAAVRVTVNRPAVRPVQLRSSTATTVSTSTGRPRIILLSPDSGFSFFDSLGNFPVPGLGFDYAHLAAINSGAGVRALIDPVTQQELALTLTIRRQAPVGFNAFPGFFPGYIPSMDQAAAQPTVVVIQQPASPDAQSSDRGRAQELEPREALPVVEPARDAGDFVLVRRDGGLLFAVAYRQGADRITYITKEGVRRGLALADLDVDATMRMNEERGTPLQFPEPFRR